MKSTPVPVQAAHHGSSVVQVVLPSVTDGCVQTVLLNGTIEWLVEQPSCLTSHRMRCLWSATLHSYGPWTRSHLRVLFKVIIRQPDSSGSVYICSPAGVQPAMESPLSPEEPSPLLEGPISARLPIYRSMISLRTFNSNFEEDSDSQPLVDQTVPREISRRSRGVSWREVLWPQLAALLWLVPTLTLLVLNTRGYVIGANAWCPCGRCFVDTADDPGVLIRYSKQTHNLLGNLQLMAKVLEVWFCVIAAWMVYSTTMILAGGDRGLPIAYMTRASEFADLASFFDRSLWTSIPRHVSRITVRPTRRPSINRLWAWVVLSCVLGVMCNLMGPAIAVLILPSLQWLETESLGDEVFLRVNSARLPMTGSSSFAMDAFGNACNETEIEQMQYQCARRGLSTDLDAMIENYLSVGLTWGGVTVQDTVSFAVHSSTYPDWGTYHWTPSRQILQAMGQDMQKVIESYNGSFSNNTSSYRRLARAQQVYLQRTGPIVGAHANMWLGYDHIGWWDVDVDRSNSSRRVIRCYASYNASNAPYHRKSLHGNYTRCVTWGVGWKNFHYAEFDINGLQLSNSNETNPKIHIQSWTSDHVAFLPDGTVPQGFPDACLVPTLGDGIAPPDCDWGIHFQINTTDPMYERSMDVNNIEISIDLDPLAGHPTSAVLAIDFVAVMSFATYSLDPNLATNPIYLATTADSVDSKKSWRLNVHPAWLLYAWAANAGRVETINRGAALELARVMYNFWSSDYYADSDPLWRANPAVDIVSIVPIMQMLSLLDYESVALQSHEGLLGSDSYPSLRKNARIYVWQYGMTSRTAFLGVFVAICGCIVVVAQFVLGFIDRRKYRSGAQLLVAALGYKYNADFADMPHEERAVAKVRYRLEDADYMAGRFKFYKVD